MFEEPTVLVLGAGASMPYGFPSGGTLIRNLFDNPAPEELTQFRNQFYISGAEMREFRFALRDSAHISIDAFLADRPDLKKIGQYLLAEQLILGERESLKDFEFLDKDWYAKLVNCIAPTKAGIPQNKLKIVTFNYDRSLEHYLFRAIKARYNLSDTETAELLKPISIVHVHGSLGKLPWQDSGESLTYGFNMFANAECQKYVGYAAERIVILGNADSNSPEFNAAKKHIREARYVFCLGFGYHPENMNRIGIYRTDNESKIGGEIFGTCYGLSVAKINGVKSSLNTNHGQMSDQRFDISAFMEESTPFLTASGWNRLP